MKLINPGGGVDTNVYNADGTLDADRTVAGGGNKLDFTGSDVSFDAVVGGVGWFDLDEDTGIFVEETADEDRIRFQTFSDYFASGIASMGHIDTDGLSMRTFARTDGQLLTADDDVDTTSGLTYRGEMLVERKALPDSVPLGGIIPSVGAGSVGSYAMFQGGRDTRVVGIGVIQEDIVSGLKTTVGMWGDNFSRQHFFGFQPGSSTWMRDQSGASETYIRVDSTRLVIKANLTGSGAVGKVFGWDNTNYSGGGGAHWMNPLSANRLQTDIGDSAVSPYDLQVFDAVLRGVSWAPKSGVLGNSATGSSGVAYGVQMNTSANPVPTPAAANLVPGIPLCTAFDAFGTGGPTGAALTSALQRVDVNMTFELDVPATGESVYEIEWWENSHDASLTASKGRITFDVGRTSQTISMFALWPGRFIGVGIGALGYSQIELRIIRISGADDIRLITSGSHILFTRHH